MTWRMKGAQARRNEMMRLIENESEAEREAMMRSLIDLGLWQDGARDQRRRDRDRGRQLDDRLGLIENALFFAHMLLPWDTGLWRQVDLDRDQFTSLVFKCIRNKATTSVLHLIIETGTPLQAISRHDGCNDTFLTASVKAGRMDVALFLVSLGCDIERVDETEGLTPLLHAIKSGNTSSVNALLDMGADVNGTGRGYTRAKLSSRPIILACGTGDLGIVQTLIQRGADVNQADSCGNTSLHAAIFHKTDKMGRGCFAVMDTEPLTRYLIEQGGDTQKLNQHGRSALHVALLKSKLGEAALLLQSIPNEAIHLSQHAPLELFKLLVQHNHYANPKVQAFIEMMQARYPNFDQVICQYGPEIIQSKGDSLEKSQWPQFIDKLILEQTTQSAKARGKVKRL